MSSAVAATVATLERNDAAEMESSREKLVNWSATHACEPQKVHRPISTAQVLEIVSACHESGTPLRVVGSGLSPNGIAFPDEQGGGDAHVICLEECNRVLRIDKENMLVVVEAGIQVGELLEELREHGMTLENLASINLQQIGGFVQVGAHGTGATIPPVEEQVVSMKMATPGKGEITLSALDDDPEAFHLAKVGLGALGVMTEVTMRCVPAHRLIERVEVMTRDELRSGHAERLRSNRHVRYMWIPYEDAVVVVSSNIAAASADIDDEEDENEDDGAAALEPLKNLLKTCTPPGSTIPGSIGFAELRDKLLASGGGPLDTDHVVRVNAAEAEFWKRHAKAHVPKPEDSDGVLAFDCGGQQWVWEVAMPLKSGAAVEIDFVERILAAVESERLPAPAPIEQRWTRGSSAAMSPAGPDEVRGVNDALFSWVGIIMYMPSTDEEERAEITKSFKRYCDLVQNVSSQMSGAGEIPYDVQSHWAKLETEDTGPRSVGNVRRRLRRRYPVEKFNALRRAYDPKGVMQNKKMKTWFG